MRVHFFVIPIMLAVLVPFAAAQNDSGAPEAQDQTLQELKEELERVRAERDLALGMWMHTMHNLREAPEIGRRVGIGLEKLLAKYDSSLFIDSQRLELAQSLLRFEDRRRALAIGEPAAHSALDRGVDLDKEVVYDLKQVIHGLAGAARYDAAIKLAVRLRDAATNDWAREQSGYTLTRLYMASGDFESAIEIIQEDNRRDGEELPIRVRGIDHANYIECLVEVGNLEHALAIALFRSARPNGSDGPMTEDSVFRLALYLWLLDLSGEIDNHPEFEAMRVTMERTARLHRRIGKPLPPLYAEYLINRGKLFEAEHILRPVLLDWDLEPGRGGHHTRNIKRAIRLYSSWDNEELQRFYEELLTAVLAGLPAEPESDESPES